MSPRCATLGAKEFLLMNKNLIVAVNAVLLAGIVIVFSGNTVLAQAVEEVSPTFSTSAAAFHTALAHRVVADQIIVGDHDMGKLLENLINLMSRKSASGLGVGATYTQAELQAVIDGSKLDKPIRMKAQDQNQAPKEGEKKP